MNPFTLEIIRRHFILLIIKYTQVIFIFIRRRVILWKDPSIPLKFIIFHESPIIERYQSEIATLKTKNEQLVIDFENLQKEKEISKKITEQLDKGLTNITKELKSVNYEIYILNKNRNKKEPFVNNLPNDSIAGEFTKYLQRRNQTR